MIIRHSPEALADIDDIWFHIAVDDKDAADGIVRRITSSVASHRPPHASKPSR